MMEQWERRVLAWIAERKLRIRQEEEEAAELLKEFWRERTRKRLLTRIELVFNHQPKHKGECAMAPVPGAVTLTKAGQVALASVLGFDQDGKPMPADFAMPPVTFTIDDSAVATLEENPDGETAKVTAEADGVATVTASVKTAQGLALSEEEQVTVDIAPPPPPPTPVLSSIKIAFDVAPSAAPTSATISSGDTGTAQTHNLTLNQKLAAAAQTT